MSAEKQIYFYLYLYAFLDNPIGFKMVWISGIGHLSESVKEQSLFHFI